MTDIERLVLTPLGGHRKVLLHSCCAPYSGEVMEAMLASDVDYTIVNGGAKPGRWAAQK